MHSFTLFVKISFNADLTRYASRLRQHLSYKLKLGHICSLVPTPALSPQPRLQFKSAVDACLQLSPKGKCLLTSPHGPIRTLDVSRSILMIRMFDRVQYQYFNSDVSTWDISRVREEHA